MNVRVEGGHSRPVEAKARVAVMANGNLSRPRKGRMIAGVCAGLARRFGVSATLVRTMFVLSIVLPGPQILVYIALWILLPRD
jgi:phage shock protein PspC (stress-responsive transcriptional regulator)